MSLLFVIHLSVTLFLTGLIWVIQIVQYPLFSQIPSESFASYESQYQKRITYVVMPTMLCELVTGILMVILNISELNRSLQIVNLVSIVLVWVSTALIQVPCHKRLMERFQADIHKRLVLSNWVRTFLWTTRSLLFLTVLVGSPSS